MVQVVMILAQISLIVGEVMIKIVVVKICHKYVGFWFYF